MVENSSEGKDAIPMKNKNNRRTLAIIFIEFSLLQKKKRNMKNDIEIK